jgi:hypothetical protein
MLLVSFGGKRWLPLVGRRLLPWLSHSYQVAGIAALDAVLVPAVVVSIYGKIARFAFRTALQSYHLNITPYSANDSGRAITKS